MTWKPGRPWLHEPRGVVIAAPRPPAAAPLRRQGRSAWRHDPRGRLSVDGGRRPAPFARRRDRRLPGLGRRREENRYRSAIWLAAVDGATPPPVHHGGEARRRAALVSGRLLPRLHVRHGDTMQLYVVPAAGGEARKLTSLDEDVTQVVWSPDGTRACLRRPRSTPRTLRRTTNVGRC